jgi:hypothetical protein
MLTAADFLKQAISGSPTPILSGVAGMAGRFASKVPEAGRRIATGADNLANKGADYVGDKWGRASAQAARTGMDDLRQDPSTAAHMRELDNFVQDPDAYINEKIEGGVSTAADWAMDNIKERATGWLGENKGHLGAAAGAAGIGGLGLLFLLMQQMNQGRQAAPQMQGQMYTPQMQMNPAATQQALQGGAWRL